MAVWLVRAGGDGANENFALENDVAAIGWEGLGSMAEIKTREELFDKITLSHPSSGRRTCLNWRSQLWQFLKEIKVGDVIALPLKSRPTVAFARVTGDYRYVADAPYDAKHQRPVHYEVEIPRSEIAQDLLFSLGAFMTVCQVRRNDAEARFLTLMQGGGSRSAVQPSPHPIGEETEEETSINLLEFAREGIRQFVAERFSGHGLARLVGAVLISQGYQIRVSPPGADGGVDVIAGSGPLGFGSPRLAVQVKSQSGPIDVNVVRELQGVMRQFGAENGLVVAWGGFKNSVIREVARQYFEIRLWSGDDLVDAILSNYESLPSDIRAELPLTRIWTVARSD